MERDIRRWSWRKLLALWTVCLAVAAALILIATISENGYVTIVSYLVALTLVMIPQALAADRLWSGIFRRGGSDGDTGDQEA